MDPFVHEPARGDICRLFDPCGLPHIFPWKGDSAMKSKNQNPNMTCMWWTSTRPTPNFDFSPVTKARPISFQTEWARKFPWALLFTGGNGRSMAACSSSEGAKMQEEDSELDRRYAKDRKRGLATRGT